MGGKRRPKKDIMDREWSSLGQLATYFNNSGEEKVKDYDGLSVTTTKHVYTLSAGQLFRQNKRKNNS